MPRDSQLAPDDTGPLRDELTLRGPQYEPDEAERYWMRQYDGWFNTLPPERQADELNRCSETVGSNVTWKVAGDEVVNADGNLYAQWIARQRVLAWKRRGVALIVRPLHCARVRSGFRRSRRVTLRRAPARSPGRPADDPDLAGLEAAA